MGIQGLTKLLNDNAPDSVKEVKFESYFGRKVAVDASMFIYQFMAVVGRQGEAQLTNEAGDVTSHLQGMFTRTVRMLDAGIRPVYVFDGKPPELKSGELAKRREKKVEAEAALGEAKEAGTAAEVEKFGKRNLKVTSEHNEECKRLLRLMGVPVVEAPCEAEATCAALCAAGLVHAAVSEDMDTLTFATPRLARNLMKPASVETPVLEFSYEAALAGLALSKEQFVDLCILCGCDYTESIRNCGPTTALKLIREHGSIEGVLAAIARESAKGDSEKGRVASLAKMKVPEEFPYEEARRLFLSPLVVDVAAQGEFRWGAPDEEALVAYLVGEKSFQEDRVRKAVAKIRAAKGKASQNRLEAFFGVPTSHKSTLGKRPAEESKGKGKGKAAKAAPGAKASKGVGGGTMKGGKK